jgi:acyl-CoA hydrolase
VAVDANRKPQAVPPLVPETDEQKRRFEKAEERKRSRQALHGRKR